jgi:hypothetical protein
MIVIYQQSSVVFHTAVRASERDMFFQVSMSTFLKCLPLLTHFVQCIMQAAGASSIRTLDIEARSLDALVALTLHDHGQGPWSAQHLQSTLPRASPLATESPLRTIPAGVCVCQCVSTQAAWKCLIAWLRSRDAVRTKPQLADFGADR